jgi:EpsI family protein
LASALPRNDIAKDLTAEWRPVFVNASTDHVGFLDGRGVIEVFRAVYVSQGRDQNLFLPENDILGEGFDIAAQTLRQIETPMHRIAVLSSRGVLAGEERVVWSWYRVAGRLAANPWQAKTAEFLGLFHGRRDAVAVAISTPCGGDCDSAESRLEGFLSRAVVELADLPRPAHPVP